MNRNHISGHVIEADAAMRTFMYNMTSCVLTSSWMASTTSFGALLDECGLKSSCESVARLR